MPHFLKLFQFRATLTGSLDAIGNCTWIKFEDATSNWIGVFGRGVASAETDQVEFFADRKYAFVIAGGQGYAVNVAGRTCTQKTSYDYLQSALSIPTSNFIIACDYKDLYLFSSTTTIWRSERLERDDFNLNQ